MVLFGFGSINRRLAELIEPFNCAVTTFSRGWNSANLDSALEKADIVACAAPDTDDTKLTFDCDRLARIPKTAVFTNFGRGSLVDEFALARALVEGRLAGAVIDVTRNEPISAGPYILDVPEHGTHPA